MNQVVQNREEFVARIPEVTMEDNTKKLADDIEKTCLQSSRASHSRN